ncbi:MAG TPA: SBBP repeat-containing protein, partial [Polyangiaceae bacterium]|nr:SBBP repeat-containing protein [Polyangiaceae bacterium]
GYLVSRYTADGQPLWAIEVATNDAFESYHDFLAVDQLGNAYVVGDTSSGLPALRLTRDGVLDPTWAPDDSGITRSVAVAARGSYVDVGGEVAPPTGAHFFRLARYDLMGRLAFSYDLHDVDVNALVEGADGSLYSIATYLGSSASLVTRLSGSGAWLGQRIADRLIAGAWGDRLYVAGGYYSPSEGYQGAILPLSIE